MDPVAGTFQNYGDEGFYRDQYGGLDSLDSHYKYSTRHLRQLKIDARTWEARETEFVTVWLAAESHTVALGTVYPHNILVDHLTVRDAEGTVVSRYELEESENRACGTVRDGGYVLIHCLLVVPIDVPRDGHYEIETAAYVWYDGDDTPGRTATLDVWVPYDEVYQEGDTWYRDMRSPGFNGELPPNSDTSLQWLAERIGTDERFSEATVAFWWPAIMGSHLADPPEDANDADFEALLLSSNAQFVEVKRLARGFQRGFHGGAPYILKDLLVEIVLSRWFRAESVTGNDPIRATALRDAGAERLLTPEELAQKTVSITGYSWGRWNEIWRPPHEQRTSLLTKSNGYRLMYGGIDSDGIIDRAADLTPLMVGIANSHASSASCPIVMREFYLLPKDQRLLFSDIDENISPDQTNGEAAIRNKMVELYDKLLGLEVGSDSTEVDSIYELFLDVWNSKRISDDSFRFEPCDMYDDADMYYFTGILEDSAWLQEDLRSFDWEVIDKLYQTIDWSDESAVARTWVVVLAYLLSDYRYLYL